ncbi:MAG: ROK family transcriptional regulator [Chloroflexi bacterium]|nr:ROK family transcriptional regulator [Chloroflexota bacterium]
MKKATRQHTKQHNSRLILKTIYSTDGISRADIARNSGLTRATVSSIVAEFIEDGLVDETGVGPSAGGKPPILLGLVEDARQLICLDLSRDPFQGALMDLRGQILQHVELPVDGRSAESALLLVDDLVNRLTALSCAPILGIGIGTPGVVDTQNGIIQKALNMDWHDIPLQSRLEAQHALPIYIANDSHLAAFAETSFGQYDTNNLVLINGGNGIGAGIVLNGKTYFGESFSSGEIGHISVAENGRQCICGNRGCLETVASVRSIMAQAQTLATQQPDLLSAWQAKDDPITWQTICRANQEAVPEIRQLVANAGKYLGMTIANLIGILNVRHIVLAGELITLDDGLLTAVCKEISQRVLSTTVSQTTISYTTLGKEIVLYGAGAFILSQELGVL